MKRLIFSPKATLDIDQIYDYTEEKWSSEQAEGYIFAIRDHCDALIAGTARGRAINGIKPGYLALASGSHFIVYKDDAQTVAIIRILHRRMNIGSHL
ncbi:type II toxin-antitoxin system RelE/ParE family toxin [Rhizobium multihospitium]|uniref:Toxin n=1 Tax=Rhizobium multihospitium TaxID=410764 RepID=A0A1C3X0X1_9HYPH|nr:type II toxin-antitoxin system RelE/ParE family toxin [Rhizobium multihospitium]SCB45879.1 toxin ParE1/3/4 [Rhizobium multihospitium]